MGVFEDNIEAESEELNESEYYALDFLELFLCDLIGDRQENNFNSETVDKLYKALYLLKNFGKINFGGELRINSGHERKGDAEHYIVTFNIDQIRFTMEGYVTGESGGDSITKHYYTIGDNEYELDIISLLDEWQEFFLASINSNPGFAIEDETEIN